MIQGFINGIKSKVSAVASAAREAADAVTGKNKGGKIILNYNFIAGDVLVIDYETRDIFLNDKDLAVSIALESVV
ncbi:hypothetical protein ACFSCZ_12600 [Siminovitchia sediminis]|uniref:Siphovirus-type tail component C-terminal domain-containing protein n=1 Tax=Siminovitchia sediminis TaxID=1274353 RepID=A0ABW4KH95_9BACI